MSAYQQSNCSVLLTVAALSQLAQLAVQVAGSGLNWAIGDQESVVVYSASTGAADGDGQWLAG